MNSKIKRVAEIIAEAILRKKKSKVLVENIKKKEKTLKRIQKNQLQEQLAALCKMNLYKQRDFVQ